MSAAARLADEMEAMVARNERATSSLQLVAPAERSAAEIAKARRVKRQLDLVDVVLDFRIRAQRAVALARRVPARDAPVCAAAGVAAPVAEKRANVADSLRRLIGVLDSLRRATGTPATVAEGGESVDFESPDVSTARVWQALEATQSADAAVQRDALLHWSQKLQAGRVVKLGTTQTLNQDILTQVERVVADKERVLRRCRTTHSPYSVVGEPEPRRVGSQHDDVYDDHDFYQALLRQVISRQDALDSTAQERAHSAQRAAKRARVGAIDSTMRKGRRLHHNVHEKLLNFAAPRQRPPIDWDQDMLFDSLFQAPLKN